MTRQASQIQVLTLQLEDAIVASWMGLVLMSVIRADRIDAS